MELIQELENINLNFIEQYHFDTYYFSYVFDFNKDTCIIIDENLCDKNENNIFQYEKYCVMQNEYSAKYKLLLRFLRTDDILKVVTNWLCRDLSSLELKDHGTNREEHTGDNSVLESHFEDVFQEVYGSDSSNFLNKEFGVSIDKDTNAFVDYIIQTKDKSFAVEENGVSYHHPAIIGQKRYIKQLVRQNTLSLLGNNVFRFSTNNLLAKEQMVENIKRFFGDKEGLVHINSIKSERKFELYQHQKEYLDKFNELRALETKSILVILPTATGKSQIVISDLQLYYTSFKRVLIMVPSVKIMEDWADRIKVLKNECVEIKTYNTAFKDRLTHTPAHYDYIVFDEAHHAQAPNCKKTIQYYNPQFLVGLTATPDRLDQKKITAIFGNYDSHLTLEEAIKKDIISNIRVFRLKSNIDLSEVRFNGKDYNNADIEKTLFIDSRNELIAETLKKYFEPKLGFYKQGLIYCVNVAHAKKLAQFIRERGLTCEAVYGINKKNKTVFDNYKKRKLQFMTTCQMISEGWDSPQTEVIVMARPTLSKVLYLQQLGRGARKHVDKECLYCIDVVDNYSAHLRPWSFNSLFNLNTYVSWMGIKEGRSTDYLELLGLSEKEMKLEEIDILTFEEKYPDIKSAEQAARILFVNTDTLRSWIKKEPSLASLYLTVGNKRVPFFNADNLLTIRKKKNLKEHNEDTILEDFTDFIDQNSLTYSFKLVFLLKFLELVDKNGECNFYQLAERYKQFYMDRLNRNLQVDRKGCVFTKAYLEDKSKLNRNILDNPFEKFERKRFIYYAKSKDFNLFSFNPILWKKMDGEYLDELKTKLELFLEAYYEQMGGL
ncbi:MAG: DEAD/DEAH box helicase [Bacteroidaceae bacterium]|nr:DEAD/DEAH box helicase [Bacteroidaceae bacterium]